MFNFVGEFTQGGSPVDIADVLKDEFDVEIYAMFVGNLNRDQVGVDTMKSLASPPDPNIGADNHFFIISDTELVTVVDEITLDSSCMSSNYKQQFTLACNLPLK